LYVRVCFYCVQFESPLLQAYLRELLCALVFLLYAYVCVRARVLLRVYVCLCVWPTALTSTCANMRVRTHKSAHADLYVKPEKNPIYRQKEP